MPGMVFFLVMGGCCLLVAVLSFFLRPLLPLVRRIAARPSAVQCGTVRCGAVLCGAVRCGAARCGAVRCGPHHTIPNTVPLYLEGGP